jgi:hypothetical protein
VKCQARNHLRRKTHAHSPDFGTKAIAFGLNEERFLRLSGTKSMACGLKTDFLILPGTKVLARGLSFARPGAVPSPIAKYLRVGPFMLIIDRSYGLRAGKRCVGVI